MSERLTAADVVVLLRETARQNFRWLGNQAAAAYRDAANFVERELVNREADDAKGGAE